MFAMFLCSAYHDRLAGPPMLLLHDQRVGNDQDRVADEGQSRGKGDPFEDALLRVRDVVVDRSLHKVASRVGCGQRLASRAGGGGFGDISIRIRGGNAAGGEGGQEEDEHKDGIGILQHRDGFAQRGGIGPASIVVGEEVQPGHVQLSGHDERLRQTELGGMRGVGERERNGGGCYKRHTDTDLH
jgi:hypothetical protein